jgi:hypothetical protein
MLTDYNFVVTNGVSPSFMPQVSISNPNGTQSGMFLVDLGSD